MTMGRADTRTTLVCVSERNLDWALLGYHGRRAYHRSAIHCHAVNGKSWTAWRAVTRDNATQLGFTPCGKCVARRDEGAA